MKIYRDGRSPFLKGFAAAVGAHDEQGNGALDAAATTEVDITGRTSRLSGSRSAHRFTVRTGMRMRIDRDIRARTGWNAPKRLGGKSFGRGVGINQLLPDILVAEAGLKNQANDEGGKRASDRDPENERHK